MNRYKIRFHMVSGETIYQEEGFENDMSHEDIVERLSWAKWINMPAGANTIRNVNMANVCYFDVIKMDVEDKIE